LSKTSFQFEELSTGSLKIYSLELINWWVKNERKVHAKRMKVVRLFVWRNW